MRLNPDETADLVTFTEETLSGKLHFLCSVCTLMILYIYFDAELKSLDRGVFRTLLNI